MRFRYCLITSYPSKMGGILLSFDMNMGPILQYATNIFGSVMPVIYLFVGAAFAIFIISKLLKVAKGE